MRNPHIPRLIDPTHMHSIGTRTMTSRYSTPVAIADMAAHRQVTVCGLHRGRGPTGLASQKSRQSGRGLANSASTPTSPPTSAPTMPSDLWLPPNTLRPNVVTGPGWRPTSAEWRWPISAPIYSTGGERTWINGPRSQWGWCRPCGRRPAEPASASSANRSGVSPDRPSRNAGTLHHHEIGTNPGIGTISALFISKISHSRGQMMVRVYSECTMIRGRHRGAGEDGNSVALA